MSTNTYEDVMVCEDCYVANEYGFTTVVRDATDSEADIFINGYRWTAGGEPRETPEGIEVVEWFAGDTDQSADREPLSRLAGIHLSNNVDSDTGDGIETFSHRSCQGCGSNLGGKRYRLAGWD